MHQQNAARMQKPAACHLSATDRQPARTIWHV